MILTNNLNKAEHLIIVDVSFQAHRATCAFDTIQTSKDISSGHIYGFFTIMGNYIKNLSSSDITCVVYVYDSKPIRKLNIYPDYKGSRVHGTNPVTDIAEALKYVIGVHVKQDGEESDDLIAWMVRQDRFKDKEITILSHDGDLCQLMCYENVTIMAKEIRTPAYLLKKFRITDWRKSKNLVIVQAIYGGKNDTIKIKGLRWNKGLGELVNSCDGSIEDFYRMVESDKFEIKKNKDVLLKNRKDIEINYRLQDLSNAPEPKIWTTAGDAVSLSDFVIKQFECRSLRSEIHKFI